MSYEAGSAAASGRRAAQARRPGFLALASVHLGALQELTRLADDLEAARELEAGIISGSVTADALCEWLTGKDGRSQSGEEKIRLLQIFVLTSAEPLCKAFTACVGSRH